MSGAPWINDDPKARLWAAQGIDPDTIAARLGRTFEGLRLYANNHATPFALPPRLPVDQRAAAIAKAEREAETGTVEAPPAGDQIEQEFSRDEGHLSSRSPRIKTVDELLAKAGVDLDVWEVERFVVNQWEMAARLGDAPGVHVEPLYQVKVWL